MAPATPISLAQTAVNEATTVVEQLKIANPHVIHALETALTALDRAEEDMDDIYIHQETRDSNYADAYQAYDAATGVYMDIFGEAMQTLRAAQDHLENIQTVQT